LKLLEHLKVKEYLDKLETDKQLHKPHIRRWRSGACIIR